MRTLQSLLFIVVLFAASESVSGQNFNSAVGLRLGYPLSISYKTFISETNAIEAYLGYSGLGWGNYITLNAAYQIHAPINGVDGLEYYYGGGAGVQFNSYDYDYVESNVGIRISGYLGLQYTFEDAPISLSADWVPTYVISKNYGYGLGVGGFGAGLGALAVRYTLGD